MTLSKGQKAKAVKAGKPRVLTVRGLTPEDFARLDRAVARRSERVGGTYVSDTAASIDLLRAALEAEESSAWLGPAELRALADGAREAAAKGAAADPAKVARVALASADVDLAAFPPARMAAAVDVVRGALLALGAAAGGAP